MRKQGREYLLFGATTNISAIILLLVARGLNNDSIIIWASVVVGLVGVTSTFIGVFLRNKGDRQNW